MSEAASAARRQRLIGIALMCGALACFACLDTMAKFLNHYMDTLEFHSIPGSMIIDRFGYRECPRQ